MGINKKWIIYQQSDFDVLLNVHRKQLINEQYLYRVYQRIENMVNKCSKVLNSTEQNDPYSLKLTLSTCSLLYV